MRSKLKWLIPAVAIVAIAIAAAVIFGKSSAPRMQEGNLLTNGDFSQSDENGLPSGWYTDAYIHTVGYTDYSMEDGVVTIVNHALNDARFAQKVTVQPDSLYCLTGYIRAQATGGLGANLSVSDVYAFSSSVYDSDEWQQVTLYGRTGKDQHSVTVFVRLGGYSGEATGTASFKDISLTQVESVPSEYIAYQWYKNTTAKATTADRNASSAWPWLTAVALIYALVCWFLSRSVLGGNALEDNKHNWLPLVGIIAVAVAARCAIALMIPGYGVDIGCFTSWANQMANNGAAEFYASGAFCDYPPGYILVLGLLGSVGKALGTGTTEFLVKLPSIMCDAAAAALLYVYSKKYISGKAAFTLSALYAFNPLTFAAGAAWGQADSVMALCILLVVILAIENKWYAALPVYMLAVLMKPQALMFGPLGLIALVVMIIREKNRKIVIHTAIGLAAAAVVAVLVILPFSKNMDNSEGWWVIRLYESTMGYYANATVNACNLYFLFGKNWASVDTDAPLLIRSCAALILLGGTLAGAVRWQWYKRGKARLAILAVLFLLIIAAAAVPMTYRTLGRLVIVFSVLLCIGMYLKGNSIRHLPLLGAVQLLLLCCTGTMMHERYLFPAVLLLALACVIERDWRVYILFILVTVCTFLNVGVVLDRGIRIGGVDGHLDAPLFRIVSDSAALEYAISALLCIVTAYSGFVAFGICAEGRTVSVGAAVKEAAPAETGYRTYSPAQQELENPEKLRRMRWQDWVIIAAVTAIYSVAALTNLGSTTSPQTWWRSETSTDSVILELGQIREFKMLYFGGIHNRDMEFTVRTSDDGLHWSEPYWAQITEGQCFQWQYVRQVNTYDGTRNYSSVAVRLSGRFVKIEAKSIALTIYEVILRDPDTQEVFPVKVREGAGENLIDEQDTFTGEPGWYNSTYFDEIYHARTGYEHYLAMNGDYTYRPYETSHPPLGKVLMAFSISIFGMTPFGWRFAGALAGILMLPGLYLLGKLLTRRRLMAAAAMLLMAFDCMHFTQTRIATIDSFVVLFIIWSMVFMVYYVRMDYWNKPFWKTLVPLFLSGLFMGLAVASKWTGCYAGVGLALLFFWSVYRRLRQSMYARDAIEEDPAKADLPRYKAASDGLWKRPVYTILSCLVFFVAIPAAIYYCSYIPYFMPYSPSGVTLQRVIEAAEGMFNYHSIPGLGMDHPFYSPWYEWPVIGKPMWYYSSTYRPEGGTQTIVAMGNPAVWWGGLLALAAILLVWILRHFRRGGISLHTKQNDMRPAILLIGFAAQFAPWMLVPRGTYIYHYFTSVPFIILCTVLCFDLLQDMADRRFILKEGTSGSQTAMQKVLHYLPSALLIVFLLASLALFIAFFPYASGQTASYGRLEAMKWFDRWIYY